MDFDRFVEIREKLLSIFDKRGVYLDEEDWSKVIQFDEKNFQAVEEALVKEFGVQREELEEFRETRSLSLQICENIVWKKEKKARKKG